MSNIILSAFSDEYAKPFDEQLVGMKSFGIDNIELRFVDGKNISTLTEREVRIVKDKLDSSGVRASAIGSPLGKIKLDGDISAHFDMAKRVFETADTVGAKYVRVFSFYAPRGKNITDMKNEVAELLFRLLLLAREYGVTLCHENEAKIYGDVPSRCKELADTFGGELKCVFDMGNFVLDGVDPVSAYEILKPYVAYFHIKDALSEGAIVPPGCGHAKIKEILEAHKKYAEEDFFVSLEPHLQTFSGLNALVGRSFENPYKYPDEKSAFADAVMKFKEII